MVTYAKKNSDDMPFFALDMQKFAKTNSFTPEDVRQYLKSNIPSINEDPATTGETRQGKSQLIQNRKELFAKQTAKAELALFEKNPEIYTALYGLKKNTEQETINSPSSTSNDSDSDKAKAKICQDENGNIFLAVEIMKPTDVSFQIHDGKLSFDPRSMSPDKLKEILSYLDRRGLLSIVNLDDLKLENADTATQDMFNQTKEDMKKVQNKEPEKIMSTEGGNENNNDAPQPTDNDLRTLETENSNVAPLPVTNADPKKDATKEALTTVTKWMDKNKRRNLSYFVTHHNGYTVFTTFDKENSDNMKLDNVVDGKTKDVNIRHECKIYIKRQPNGKVEISFSMPNNKPITDVYADAIVEAHRDAGNTRVEFGPMTDPNQTAFRIACARAFVVPVGIKLSQTKFDKMMDASEAKNGKNNPKVLKYKKDLALEFAYQLQQKGIDWTDEKNKNNADCRCIRNAIGAYDYSPFRDLWEDFGLRAKYESIIKASSSANSNGAAAAIGATKAVSKLYNAYKEGIDSSDGTLAYLVSDRCTSLTPDEKQAFKQIIAGIENTPVRDIPPKTAIQLFDLMEKTQEQRASIKIEDEYKRLVHDDFYKGNASRDAVQPYLNEAVDEITNVKSDLAEFGLPQIGVVRIGSPKYDFSKLQEQLRAGQRRSQNHQNGSTFTNVYNRHNDGRI